MENINIISAKITAFVIHDVKEGVFTLYMKGKGGPIVSAPDLDEAKKLFGEALDLSCAVSNLNVFAAAVKEAEEEINKQKEQNKDKSSKHLNIEYIDVEIPAYAA